MRWKNYGQRSNWQRVEPRLGDPPGRAGWQFPRHFEHLPDDPWQVVMRIGSTRRGMIQDLDGWLPRMGQPLFQTVLGKGRARSALQLCRRRLGRVGTLFELLDCGLHTAGVKKQAGVEAMRLGLLGLFENCEADIRFRFG